MAGVVVVLDQLTKAWIVANLEPGERLVIVDDLLRLIHHQNTGALFGLFRDSAPLFAAVSVVIVGGIVVAHARSGRNLLWSVALGLLLGGAIGNAIDRFRHGHVVDFVDMGIGDLRFWTYNVADAAISTSLLLIVLALILPGLAATPAAATDPDATTDAGSANPTTDAMASIDGATPTDEPVAPTQGAAR